MFRLVPLLFTICIRIPILFIVYVSKYLFILGGSKDISYVSEQNVTAIFGRNATLNCARNANHGVNVSLYAFAC